MFTALRLIWRSGGVFELLARRLCVAADGLGVAGDQHLVVDGKRLRGLDDLIRALTNIHSHSLYPPDPFWDRSITIEEYNFSESICQYQDI